MIASEFKISLPKCYLGFQLQASQCFTYLTKSIKTGKIIKWGWEYMCWDTAKTQMTNGWFLEKQIGKGMCFCFVCLFVFLVFSCSMDPCWKRQASCWLAARAIRGQGPWWCQWENTGELVGSKVGKRNVSQEVGNRAGQGTKGPGLWERTLRWEHPSAAVL